MPNYGVLYNGNARTELTLFETLEQYFNPTLNTVWERRYNRTVNALLNQIQVFFGENRANYEDLYNRGMFTYQPQGDLTLRNLLSYISPGDRWYLAFFSIHNDRAYYYKPRASNYVELPAGQTHISYDVEAVIFDGSHTRLEHIKALLTRVKTDIREFRSAYGDRIVPSGVDASYFHLAAVANGGTDWHFQNFTAHNPIVGWNTDWDDDEEYWINEGELHLADIAAMGRGRFNVHISSVDGIYYTEVIGGMTGGNANNSRLHRVMGYSTNVLEYLPEFQYVEGESASTPVFGVELEVSTDYTVVDLIDACERPFFIAKQDSSITGDKARMMELVTTPCSLERHKEAWGKFFENLDYDNFDTSLDTHNGMHVHCSSGLFTNERKRRNFMWFYGNPAHRSFLLQISERDESSFDTYSAMPNFNNATKADAYNRVAEFMRTTRGIINISHRGTIEVRLFRGVVAYADILKNLEFVEATLEYCNETKRLEDLNLTSFIDYVNSEPERYSNLIAFIGELDLDLALTTAEVQDVIFNSRNTDEIERLIVSSSLLAKLNDKHVTVLNKHIGYEKFEYQIGEAKFGNKPKTKISPIAHRNKEQQARYIKKYPGKGGKTSVANPPSDGQAVALDGSTTLVEHPVPPSILDVLQAPAPTPVPPSSGRPGESSIQLYNATLQTLVRQYQRGEITFEQYSNRVGAAAAAYYNVIQQSA